MSKEFKNGELADSLIESAERYLMYANTRLEAPVVIDGVEIDYPYSDIKYAPYDQYIPSGMLDSFSAMEDLFQPGKVPSHWLEFIKEVDNIRKEKGCGRAVNLAEGLIFLAIEDTHAKEYGLNEIGETSDGYPDFSDSGKIAEMIDIALSVPYLRDSFKNILSDMMPDVSNSLLNKDKVAKVLHAAGINSGVALDIGCGTGRDTIEWQEKLGLFTLGLDRQYHAKWYNTFWVEGRDNNPQLQFARADYEHLPLANSSVDVAIFHCVAQHVTKESLEKGLDEAKRALKDNGLLVVGPQYDEDYSGWRFFRKSPVADNTPVFAEYSYYDFVPSEKPKPVASWRIK